MHHVWNCPSDMQGATTIHSYFILIEYTCGKGKTDRSSNSDTFTNMKTTVFLYEAIICVLMHADQHKMQHQGTKWRRNIAEDFNRLSRVHERYRQTTDRQTGDDT